MEKPHYVMIAGRGCRAISAVRYVTMTRLSDHG
jgi:hypothetical protein